MPAHKSAISVGLLYIPVSLQKATRDISISFNQLTKDTHERIQYKKYCPNCTNEVPAANIIKGYEYQKGKYVVVDNDELEKIKTKKDKTIHIEHFAKLSEVDQIYYEKNYYLVPDPGAEKAYELLRQAMFSQKEVGVAKTVIGTTEQLLVLYPTKDIIIAKTLFYQEEIQPIPKSANSKVEKAELDMAKMMISSMTKSFDIAAYHDEYQQRLREAIEQKIKGQEIVNIDSSAPDNIIDLMEALKGTIEMAKDKGTA
ncbi:MAG: Ku protein [Lachnospiraceae bacterium]